MKLLAFTLSALNLMFFASCKEVESNKSLSNMKSIDVKERVEGRVGLVDLNLAFAGEEHCVGGGVIYEMFHDINSSGVRENSEAVGAAFKSCILDSVNEKEDELASYKLTTIELGDSFVTSHEELASYMETGPYQAKSMIRTLIPEVDTYEKWEEVKIPVAVDRKITEAIFDWDFALLGITDIKEISVFNKNILNLNSISKLENLESLSLTDIPFKSEHLHLITGLKKLDRLELNRVGVLNTTPLLNSLKNNPDLDLRLDVKELLVRSDFETLK